MEDENTLVPNEVLLNLISCNICNEFIGDQIFQCPSGHTSCITCARKIDFCAVCRTRMPNTGTRTGIRNRALEQLLTSINKIPCIQEGCDTKTSFLEMNDHYFNCKHRTVQCPVLNCNWTGKLEDIDNHACEKHSDDAVEIDNSCLRFLVTNPQSLIIDAYAEKIIKYKNRFYVFNAWLVKDQTIPSTLTFTIINIGTETHSTVWNLSVDSQKYQCKYSYESESWKVTDNMHDLIRSPYNLAIQLTTALSIGDKEPKFREFDLLRLEPRSCSLNIPIMVKVMNEDYDQINNIDLELVPINED
jgi:hypothetical protein